LQNIFRCPPGGADGLVGNSASDWEKIMESILIEIRSAEGGEDAKNLVLEQHKIYNRFCALEGL
jgi:hypothetical protein